ncbi:hypothetical protein J4462_02395, partial [Candidatus Pacearchaeota archaeon]|nr:hypothetical protein [Candidatus Pacearchaeota archaeon]
GNLEKKLTKHSLSCPPVDVAPDYIGDSITGAITAPDEDGCWCRASTSWEEWQVCENGCEDIDGEGVCSPGGDDHYKVFVTSRAYNGEFYGLVSTGITAGDELCFIHAGNAGLYEFDEFNGGPNSNWKAWLSDSTISASDRLYHSQIPYKKLDGVKIADDWNDLIDGSLDAPINVDENGNLHQAEVWTGTDPRGFTTNYNCNDWQEPNGMSGSVGDSSSTNDGWTVVSDHVCSNLNAIYCFEQPLGGDECVAPPEGLVSWWADDKIDVWDGNDGSALGGVGYTRGKVGEAISFDGIDDYIQVPDNDNLDFGSDDLFTVELWIKTSSASNEKYIFENGADCSDCDGYSLKIQSENDGGNLIFTIDDSDGNHPYVEGYSLNGNTEWRHVVVGRMVNELVLFVDGEHIDSQVDTTTSDLENGQELTIGALFDGVGTSNHFSGLLDELSIYNRALTEEEIQSIYQAGSAGKCYAPHCEEKWVCIDEDTSGYQLANCRISRDSETECPNGCNDETGLCFGLECAPKLVSDGDPFTEGDDNWVWILRNLDAYDPTMINSPTSISGPTIGIANNFNAQNLNENVLRQPEYPDYERDYWELPNNYISLYFDSLFPQENSPFFRGALKVTAKIEQLNTQQAIGVPESFEQYLKSNANVVSIMIASPDLAPFEPNSIHPNWQLRHKGTGEGHWINNDDDGDDYSYYNVIPIDIKSDHSVDFKIYTTICPPESYYCDWENLNEDFTLAEGEEILFHGTYIKNIDSGYYTGDDEHKEWVTLRSYYSEHSEESNIKPTSKIIFQTFYANEIYYLMTFYIDPDTNELIYLGTYEFNDEYQIYPAHIDYFYNNNYISFIKVFEQGDNFLGLNFNSWIGEWPGSNIDEENLFAKFKLNSNGETISLGKTSSMAEDDELNYYYNDYPGIYWTHIGTLNNDLKTAYGSKIINPNSNSLNDKIQFSLFHQTTNSIMSLIKTSESSYHRDGSNVPLGRNIFINDLSERYENKLQWLIYPDLQNPLNLLKETINYNNEEINSHEALVFGLKTPSVETSLTSNNFEYEDKVYIETFKAYNQYNYPNHGIKYIYAFDDPIFLEAASEENPLQINFLGQCLSISNVNAQDKSITVKPCLCTGPPIETHLECSNNACIAVEGRGENSCLSNQDCVANSHTQCNFGTSQCVQVPGPGESECNSDTDCNMENFHTECDFWGQCVMSPGRGINECSASEDCESQQCPEPCPRADYNDNGEVDINDVGELIDHLGESGCDEQTSSCYPYDLDCNSGINQADEDIIMECCGNNCISASQQSPGEIQHPSEEKTQQSSEGEMQVTFQEGVTEDEADNFLESNNFQWSRPPTISDNKIRGSIKTSNPANDTETLLSAPEIKSVTTISPSIVSQKKPIIYFLISLIILTIIAIVIVIVAIFRETNKTNQLSIIKTEP